MFLEFLLGLTLTVIGDSQGGVAVPYLRKDYIVHDYHQDGARVSGTCLKNLDLNNEIVIVFLGSNHYDDIRAPNVDCVLKMVENSKKCVWVGPPQIRGKKWEHDNALKNKVKDSCDYISTQDIKDLPDSIHFGKDGIITIIGRIKGLI
jgi:hypothetical protein